MFDVDSSQEQAFDPKDLKVEENVFKFDESEEKTPASQAEPVTKTKEGSDSASDEDKESDVEEQRVPYSRFKKKVDEVDEYRQTIARLEGQLAERKQQSAEAKSEEMPEEWRELYGNSDASKKAWAIQQKREAKLAENAIKEAIALVKKEREAEIAQEAQSEEAIDNYLSSLQETLGEVKLTKKLEEELLTIVDEFSPTGADGKYTSLISPDKALEIYNLRKQKKEGATRKAREQVASLTNGRTEGETDNTSTHYEPSWDAWRKAV